MRRLTIVFACLLIGASAVAAPSGGPSGSLPVEQFTRFDEFGVMKISPDGQHYAVLTGKYGMGTVGFIRLEDKKIVGALLAPEGFVIDDFWWVSNSRIIFTIGEQEWGLKTPVGTGEIFGSNMDATQERFLYGYRAGQMQTGSHIKVREASYASADVISTRLHDDRHVLLSELRAYLERTLGTDKNEWHARSPVYNADKIEVPVLLIHGKADWRADFEQATRMKAALERNRKQFEWMALKREGHGVFDEDSRREVYTRILQFLDQNIGSARTAAN